jgi:hypothetical protein
MSRRLRWPSYTVGAAYPIYTSVHYMLSRRIPDSFVHAKFDFGYYAHRFVDTMVRLAVFACGILFRRIAIQETSEVAMRSFLARLPSGLLVCLGIALLASGTGCGPKTTPPGASVIGTSAPGMNIQFLRWKEGLIVLFVDDVKGSHSSHGSGSTDNPVHTSTVSAGSEDAGGYQCVLETKDGKSANCRINGKDCDLSKGTLFVIKAKGDQVEVHQLKRDLTTIPFEVDGCKEPLEKDAEIRKLLGLGDLPK